MSAQTVPAPSAARGSRIPLPTVPAALAWLLQTIVVALFLLTFLVEPSLIPSDSMEKTLLAGDFLLINQQTLAPAGPLGRWLMPYREPRRGDIVVFHHPHPELLVKRVIGLPGDRVHIRDGAVWVNGAQLPEPYATFDPAAETPVRDTFPATAYTDPTIDVDWWHEMRSLVHDGDLLVPPGQYFVLGDNRNHSSDSRFWGLVPRNAIVARPLLIYFSITRPNPEQAPDDRLTHDRELSARLTGFARWDRIFRLVR